MHSPTKKLRVKPNQKAPQDTQPGSFVLSPTSKAMTATNRQGNDSDPISKAMTVTQPVRQ